MGRTHWVFVRARRNVQRIFGLLLVLQQTAHRPEPQQVVRARRTDRSADVPNHTEIRRFGPKW